MKIKLITIVSIIAVVGVLLALHFYTLDGLDGWFWSSGFVDDTVYAPGYSDRAFRMVKVGMSRGDVEHLLGTSIDGPTFSQGLRIERWSKAAHDGSFRERVIRYNNDVVVSKYSGFYID